MNYLVSITSQGQISIPAPIRKSLGLNKFKKAYVKQIKDTVVIEPVSDILSLEGSLKKYGLKNKGKSIDEIIKMEEKAWENAAAERYRKSIK